MGLIEMMKPSFTRVSVGLLNHLIHFLGKSGKIETMIKVIVDFHHRLSLYLLNVFYRQYFFLNKILPSK